jgi:hypothetical protein
LTVPSQFQRKVLQLRITHVTSAVDDTAPGIRAVVEGTIRELATDSRMVTTLIGIVPQGAA